MPNVVLFSYYTAILPNIITKHWPDLPLEGRALLKNSITWTFMLQRCTVSCIFFLYLCQKGWEVKAIGAAQCPKQAALATVRFLHDFCCSRPLRVPPFICYNDPDDSWDHIKPTNVLCFSLWLQSYHFRSVSGGLLPFVCWRKAQK